MMRLIRAEIYIITVADPTTERYFRNSAWMPILSLPSPES